MAILTINDISDLARILEEHPEWAETLRSLLLTREVLELPEKVAQQADNLAQLTVRVDQLTQDVAQLTERVDQHYGAAEFSGAADQLYSAGAAEGYPGRGVCSGGGVADGG